MSDVLVVSDFNAELVSRYLSADRSLPACSASSAPYGQVFQSLAAGSAGGGETSIFLWTRPEGVIPGWARQLAGEAVALEELLADVDTFAAAVATAAGTHRLLLVASWVPSRNGRGLGMLDWSRDGHARRLAQMNLRLAERLSDIKGVFMLDAQRWLDRAATARDGKQWFLVKSPFTEAVCQAAARDVKAALRGAAGLGRKLLVLDLDDTLWGGIVGDQGWQTLRLGGHDHIGEAFVEFQRAVMGLSRRGIALAVVSKNDEAVALEAIDSHPEMIIRRNDLAGWRINWTDKAANIVALAGQLNLGLDAVVFVDDNPTERGRVREALPQVLVPEWPKDPTHYADALLQLDCFDQASITAEDRARAAMYAAERSRRETSVAFSSMDSWLHSLEIRVRLAPAGEGNLKRLVQLVNKTNQMNLSTRRLTEAEMAAWLAGGEGRGLTTLTVADRFGDLGLTGVLSWETRGDDLHVVDYILSCRAMGRKVEEVMAHLAVEAARAAGRRRVVARLLPTERNRPCREFWQGSGFSEAEPDLFIWDAAAPYPLPDAVALDHAG